MDYWFGCFMGLIVGLCAGALLGSLNYTVAKGECEAELPRNVECVWAAPKGE